MIGSSDFEREENSNDEDDEMEDVVQDPFASISRVPHEGFSEHYELTFDIHNGLFEWFFDSEEFRYWSSSEKTWSLHVFGGPGCGKTTLAALAGERLRKSLQETAVPVASIFIDKEVSSKEAIFVEDLLASIHSQLAVYIANTNHEVVAHSKRYDEACKQGRSTAVRIRLVRKALIARLSLTDHALLILDGYDRLSEGLQLLFDREMEELFDREMGKLRSNLRVLLTRRVPPFQRAPAMACDNCEREVKLYWECQACKKRWLCNDCKKLESICKNCQSRDRFLEPYDFVAFDISRVPDGLMRNFITWNYKQEFGVQEVEETGKRLVEYITTKSRGNVTIAKIRLEDAFTRHGSQSTDKVADRLPRSIIGLFDIGIKRIESQPEAERLLALIGLVMAAGNEYGVSLTTLGESIAVVLGGFPPLAGAPPRSVEDVIAAAGGFLVLDQTSDENEVSCFHSDFALYVQENYNDALFSVKTQLERLREPRNALVSRVLTSPALVGTPPTMGTSFDTVSDAPTLKDDRSLVPSMRSGSLSRTWPQGLGLWTGSIDHISMSPPRMDSGEQVPTLARETKEGFDRFANGQTVSSATRICRLCREQILDAGKPLGRHHDSLEKANEGKAQQCTFCQTLYRDIGIRKFPMYRWTVRGAGRSRETGLAIAVVFRRITPNGPDKESVDESAARTFYMLPADEVEAISDVSLLSNSTDPTTSAGVQIRKWLKECNDNHEGCRKHVKGDFVPTRLLDLENSNQGFVRLVITGEENIEGPYCTLSHSWGRIPFVTTTPKNLEEFKTKGVEISRLSTNFQQAIAVAQVLDMRYIWIDSLTIVQNDGGKDFSSEGQLMHKVYRYSYCNIAAADASNSTQGLFRPRNPEHITKHIIPARYKGNGSSIFGDKTWRILSESFWDDELLGTKIYTRGWVFQERMLSPRLLHFAQNQIFWDCGTLSACETIPAGLPRAIDGTAATDRHWRGRLQALNTRGQGPVSGANDDSIEEFWRTALTNYTSCDLTKQVDKTVAIWSVAKLVRDIVGQEYGCGMWEFGLEEQLAWRVANIDQSAKMAELNWRYPSWSWASVRGAAIAQDRLTSNRILCAKNHNGTPIAIGRGGVELKTGLKDAKKESDLDNEPALKSNSIPIQGHACRATLQLDPQAVGYQIILPEPDVSAGATVGSFVAYPDERPAADNFEVGKCIFLILAASKQATSQKRGVVLTAIPFNELPPAPTEATYFGLGLLLQNPHTFKVRYERQLPQLESRLAEFPSSDDSWDKKNLIDEIAYVKSLLAQIEEQQKDCEEGKLRYRRVGAVQFRDVDERTWQELLRDSMTKFWLD
ncbi:heterokaryon incompatibility protein-domain-containing protein [Lophiotrema nucula]|uniref:Heterokaryon incompatibility protein-domain-containing protein n=1 Tax=Lophiotrema nucula TaxID=690887 RepID=A0A6A5ZVN5_9PLEO|nr:heterokaryon incompatibility protein-domain-containing protein [Lophiotrema nucula]